MYLVFNLYTPTLSVGYLKEEIYDWATKHDIKYTEKTIKYTHRLAFDDDRLYSMFFLTWPHTEEWLTPKLVTPEKPS